jgi:Ca-activated chloride channel homolog
VHSSDPQLDAALRNVPLPEGLLDRLRAVALTDDDDIDAAVRDVPVPRGLLKSLRYIPLADDDGLDEALRGVPIPTRLIASWRRRARKQDRLIRLSRLVVAASVIAAVTLAYVAARLMPPEGPDIPRPVVRKSQNELENSWGSSPLADGLDWVPASSLAELGPPRIQAPPPKTAAWGTESFALPADPLAVRPERGLLGANDTGTDVLTPVPGLSQRGIDWPPIGQFPYNGHMFFSPAASPRLRTNLVPLGVDTASYELTWRYLERGRLPPPKEVRVEDFLAAMDYEFPRPDKQPLGVAVHAGPSPFGGEGLCLVQVCVQARQLSDENRAPVHLVLAVDVSESMNWGSRIHIAREGLEELTKQLVPADRLSLVSFSDQAHLLVQDVSTGPFLEAVSSLAAKDYTNVTAGLQEAFSVAREQAGPTAQSPAVRVVLLTDGMAELDGKMTARLEQLVAEAAGRGVCLHVIDLGQGKEGDANMAALARAGQGAVHRAANVDQVRWAFREILTGRPQLVARDAQLKVTFNPKTVQAYRLLGHEALGVAGPANLRADFREGQAATALYEVRVASTGPSDVASVELTWYPSDDKPRSEKDLQRAPICQVDRKQFASSFAGMAPSLQEAALVAQTAEVLHGKSSVLMVQRALSQVLALAPLVDSSIKTRPSFNTFCELVKLAEKAKEKAKSARPPR